MDREVWKKQKEIIKQMKQNNPHWPTEKPKPHGSKQMSLGSLIKALQRERVGLPVVVSSVYQGYADRYPGMPHSYHGYPADLAFTVIVPFSPFFALTMTKANPLKASR